MQCTRNAVLIACISIQALQATVAALPLLPIKYTTLRRPFNASLGSTESITTDKSVISVNDLLKVLAEGTVRSENVGYDVPPLGALLNIDRVWKHTEAANETSLELSGNFTFCTASLSGSPCVIISNMGVKLCFRAFGLQIPAYKVKRMFDGASIRIRPLHGKDPQERIPNHCFSYVENFNATGDSVSTTIHGSPRATIIWIELEQILLGLCTYMKGIRPRILHQEMHLQALGFDIITSGKAEMGAGWVRYTPRKNDIESIERRSNTNETFPLSLPSPGSYGGAVIAGPDFDLYFNYHGDAASPLQMKSLFNQALLDFPVSEDIVPTNSFHCRTAYNKTNGGASINVQWLTSYRMTYDTLYRILLELQIYVNGDHDRLPHCEDLVFEITASSVMVGNGSVWYVPGTAAIGRPGVEARAVPTGTLLLPEGPNSPLPQRQNSTFGLPEALSAFPVPGSTITLDIHRISTPAWGIGFELFDLFTAALDGIERTVRVLPNHPIAHNAYKCSKLAEQGGILEFNVVTDANQIISWQDLKDVINGLNAFYNYDPDTGWYRNFASRFDVNKAGMGRIGSGNLTLVGGALN